MNYTTTLPSNRAYSDLDIVQPTKYKIPPNRIAKKPRPSLRS